jgi:membrane associated rhomboid family serine protease
MVLRSRWSGARRQDVDVADAIEVGRFGTVAEADRHALVLAAVGIGCRLVADGGAVKLLVAGVEAAERARLELTSYERENAPRQRPALPARPLSSGFDTALAYCAVLLFFFVASRRHAFGVDWLEIGAAASGRILQGEWWRTVTALALHADFDHLLGNLLFGTLFGLLVAQLLGWGLGWLAIIVAGTLGNFIDALLHPAGHSAIGASTALFGALGILAAHAWQARVLTWRGGVRRWAPLAGGTMLLVLLGTSGERTDVTAHVAGFAAGWLIGLALAGSARMPQGPRSQRLYAVLGCGLVTLAWLLALHAPM